MTHNTEEVFDLVIAEMKRAGEKFPSWPDDPLHALAVIGEEYGELNMAILQTIYEPEKSNEKDVRLEAIQLAAMAIRFLVSLDEYKYLRATEHTQDK